MTHSTEKKNCHGIDNHWNLCYPITATKELYDLFVEREQGKQKKAQSKMCLGIAGAHFLCTEGIVRLVFLSSYFFDKHAGDCEIEREEDRPHARILLSIEGLTFAIPFRSNICHQYAFFTDKKNKCGLDYSKAVLILDENKDIDKSRTPIIRQNEFDALKGKDKVIEQGMRRYLRIYKRAKLDV